MGIHIELVNPNRSYFAGQIVEGRVVVHNQQADNVKEVTIALEGRGRVHWTEQESYTVYTTHTGANGLSESRPETRSRTVTYTAEENYVLYKSSLEGDGHNSFVLPEGYKAYPFRFGLPNNLPSSFTSHVGQVSYMLKGEIKRSFFRFNDRTRLPFTVNGIFDLNLQPGANFPQQCQKDKGSNCCACRSGHINFVMQLPHRSGFVPGEMIDFRAEMTNRSNQEVTGVKASLQQVTTFYAQGKSKTVRKLISDLRGPGVEEGEYEVWEERLSIPAVPPTKLGGNCHIIDLQYFVHFEMKISGISSSLSGMIPVMIGTIPLRTTFGSFQQGVSHVPGMPGMPMPSSSQPSSGIGFNLPNVTSEIEPKPPTANYGHDFPEKFESPPGYSEVAPTPTAPVFSEYPDLPPPTYAEAVGTEGFTWNAVETENGHDHSQGAGHGAGAQATSQPSAPTFDEFVPNYITYNRRM